MPLPTDSAGESHQRFGGGSTPVPIVPTRKVAGKVILVCQATTRTLPGARSGRSSPAHAATSMSVHRSFTVPLDRLCRLGGRQVHGRHRLFLSHVSHHRLPAIGLDVTRRPRRRQPVQIGYAPIINSTVAR